MSEWNPWEQQLPSWTPRSPSGKVRARLFGSATEADMGLGGSWNWLAPVLGCFLVLTGLSYPRSGQVFDVGVDAGRDWMGLVARNQNYAAYIDSGFASDKNALKSEPIEWRTGAVAAASPHPILAGKTNSLIR